MAMRKKTLRRMPPQARKVARLLGNLDSVSKRLKNMLPEIQDMELWQRAEQKRQQHYPQTNEEPIFTLSKDDVLGCARDLRLAEEAITDDVLEQVKTAVSWGLDCWPDVVKAALKATFIEG